VTTNIDSALISSELVNSNVIVSADNIIVSDPITGGGLGTLLMLEATGTIQINAAISTLGNVSLKAGGDVTQTAAIAAAGLSLEGAGSFTLQHPHAVRAVGVDL